MTLFNATISRVRQCGPVCANTIEWPISHRNQRVLTALLKAWRWLSKSRGARKDMARLLVVDRVSVGEKNAVAVVQVDGRRFLVGAASMSVNLLAELQTEPSFSTGLSQAPKTARARSKKTTPSLSTRTEGSL